MKQETFFGGRIRLICGDALAGMNSLEENSVHSIVCDPPYHLHSIVKRFAKTGRTDKTRSKSGPHQRTARGFMNKTWDGGDVAFQPETWEAALRILKPGGYLIAMSGTRTYHRMACAIEDAGFIVYDQLGWAYGQGFPKSVNMALEFETLLCERRVASKPEPEWFYVDDGAPMRRKPPYRHPEANQWHGYGTALKPAWEPICLARKPLDGKTIRENVSKHGAGALNIDGCRVGDFDPDEYVGMLLSDNASRQGEASADRRYTEVGSTNFAATPGPRGGSAKGRFPANIVHDGSNEVLAAFPIVGDAHAPNNEGSIRKNQVFGADNKPRDFHAGFSDAGSAARFFYTAKADGDDRLGSKHPTVKPLDLMQWLVRLVTPKGGTTFDPFAGTGTTGEAAWREGMNCILIERETEYQEDIRRRMALCMAGPDERKRESIKAKTKDLPQDHGPLFS